MSNGSSIDLSDPPRGVALTISSADPPQGKITFASPRHRLTLTAEIDLADDAGRIPTCIAALRNAGRDDPGRRHLTRRAAQALPTAAHVLRAAIDWLFRSREDTNYTYDLDPRNMLHMAHAVALVTGCPVEQAKHLFAEAIGDAALTAHITASIERLPQALREVADPTPRFGRRLAWYAVVRALKPTLVVETGVDKGLGGVLLCAALLRNAADGAAGRYLGTDIRPDAGYLVSGRYAEVGRVAHGDSLATLRGLGEAIGVFINDSDHSVAYERAEYEAVRHLLGPSSVILGDNAHATDELAQFAAATDRRFLFFREQPRDHFYPGAGVGFAFGSPP